MHLLSKPIENKHINKIQNLQGIILAKKIVELAKDGYDLSEFVERYPLFYDQFETAMEEWIIDKSGVIYVIDNEFLPGLVKVGLTRKTAEDRICSLSTAGLPSKFRLLHSWNTLNVYNVENQIHKALSCIHVEKEFFRNDLSNIVQEIVKIVDHERNIITRRLMFLQCIQKFMEESQSKGDSSFS